MIRLKSGDRIAIRWSGSRQGSSERTGVFVRETSKGRVLVKLDRLGPSGAPTGQLGSERSIEEGKVLRRIPDDY